MIISSGDMVKMKERVYFLNVPESMAKEILIGRSATRSIRRAVNLVEKPNAEFLTDEQWLTLINLNPDSMTVRFSFPRKEGEDCTLYRAGTSFVIHSDGSYEEYAPLS